MNSQKPKLGICDKSLPFSSRSSSVFCEYFQKVYGRKKELLILVLMLLLVLAAAEAWVVTYYVGAHFNEYISWQSNDGAYTNTYSLGSHYFSDYTEQHLLAMGTDPTSHGNIYPPFAVIIVKIFSVFPYKLGLFLYLGSSVFALILPLLHYAFRKPSSNSLVFVFLLGVFTTPFVASLDRGNVVSFLVPFVYFGFHFLNEKKYYLAMVFLGLAVSIKIYPITFVILLLLGYRKIKLFFGIIVLFLLTQIISAYLWIHRNPIETLWQCLLNLKKYNYIFPEGHGINTSGTQIIINMLVKLQLQNNSYCKFLGTHLLVVQFFLFVVLALASFLRRDMPLSAFLGLYSMQLIPLISWSYSRVWTIAASAVLLAFPLKRRLDQVVSWVIIICNSSLVIILQYWPVNLLPTISLIVLVLWLIPMILSNIKLKISTRLTKNSILVK